MTKTAHIRAGVSFDDAFAAARSAGCDFFEWDGKRYHTRRKDDQPPQKQPIITHIVEDSA